MVCSVNHYLSLKYGTTRNKNIEFVDFTDVFLHPKNGSLRNHMYMVDLLHPSMEGQDVIMHHLQTFFDRLITLSDVPMIPSRFS
jgi:hypothetical protein